MINIILLSKKMIFITNILSYKMLFPVPRYDNGNELCYEDFPKNIEKKNIKDNYIITYIDDDYDEWLMKRKYSKWMQKKNTAK